jgi:aminomethyltransferase
MPIGTPFHQRTHALCASLSYREWAGYFAVSSYETQHEHEYTAIRNAAALIDISPLFKYTVTGPDATRLVNRVVTRDVEKMAAGQVIYTPWCDERGKVIDDGTVTRLADQEYRWTAADPNLRWFRQNAHGLDVVIDDVSERVAALALQGPTSARVLRDCADAEIDTLRYFRMTRGRIGRVPVDISRTGYTGDLGYELWMPADGALAVWDAVVAAGRAHGLMPAGMLAVDLVRTEAGLLLIDVDFHSCRRALIEAQMYSPFEMGLARLVDTRKTSYVGHDALSAERRRGTPRRVVGLEVYWEDVEALYDRIGLPPVAPSVASRVAVPVYDAGRQVGRATTTAWSPVLKRMIALATVDVPHDREGTVLGLEMTIEAVRHRVRVRVVPTPFFAPARKMATPPD